MSLPKDWKNRPASELPWWMLLWLLAAALWVCIATLLFSIAVAKQFPEELRLWVLIMVFPVTLWRVGQWG